MKMILGFVRAGGLLVLMALVGCSMATRDVNKLQPQQVSFSGPAITDAPKASDADLLPPQSLPGIYEELWIVEKPSPQIHRSPKAELTPGSGMLLARNGQNLVNCPLKHTQYNAQVNGTIATVDVSQQFSNPTNQTAEMIYSFSLPDGAGASDFVMTIGPRHIRGIIREREEARKIYQQAQTQGYVASLLTETASNLYVQSVANVEPGRPIDVQMRYFHVVEYRDGWFTMAFPLVAGSHGKNWPQPAGRNGRDAAVAVQLNPGMPIEKVESSTHGISVTRTDGNHATVALKGSDNIANQDFVLRFKPGGDGIRSALVSQRVGADQYYSLTLLPPEDWRALPRRPLELVLVGIVGNPSLQAQAIGLGAHVLQSLHADDTFIVLNLSESASRPPAPATRENVESVLALRNFVEPDAQQLLQLAATQPADPGRQRVICVLSDGQDVPEALRPAHAQLLVIGVEPMDRSSINRLAAHSGGAAIYCDSKEDARPLISETIERFAHPALSQVALNIPQTQSFGPSDRNNVELLPGRPLMFNGFVHGSLGEVTVAGKSDSNSVLFAPSAKIELPPDGPLPALCARLQLAALLAAPPSPESALADQIRRICLEHGLVSRFTSFICVDARNRVAPNSPVIPTSANGNAARPM